MEYSLLCIIRFFFKGACCFCALIMVFYWIFEFAITDEDLSVVDYKNFHQESSIFIPEVSLCVENPFIEDNLKEINSSLTVSRYLEFLKGDIFEVLCLDPLYRAEDSCQSMLKLLVPIIERLTMKGVKVRFEEKKQKQQERKWFKEAKIKSGLFFGRFQA